MHNLRPVGQMWPAEAFNSARKAQNFHKIFHENTLCMRKNIELLNLKKTLKFFVARHAT
jgi:hypothetical protein